MKNLADLADSCPTMVTTVTVMNVFVRSRFPKVLKVLINTLMLHFSSDFYVISFIVTFSTLPYSDSGDANYDIKLQRWACDNLSIKKTNLSLLILSKPKIFFTFASVFIRFFKSYKQIGTFRLEIYSIRNLRFNC